MTRRRGDLFRDVLAAMPEGEELSTPTIAAAVPRGTLTPNRHRALIGVTLCRAEKKGLVERTDAQAGTPTGRTPATWKRTGAAYVVDPGGGRPDPTKPFSRYKPRRPREQQPTVRRRTEAEKPRNLVRPEPLPPPVVPLQLRGPETVEEFIARGGQVEVLPGFCPALPARLPVREVYRGRGGL